MMPCSSQKSFTLFEKFRGDDVNPLYTEDERKKRL